MRKTIFCIFAHPDDESFGPSGTIATLAKDNDVYVLCATKGDAGQNHHMDKTTSIEELRAKELRNSAEILGVKHVFFLGFRDGTLCNNIYHEIVEQIKVHLEQLKPEIFLTYEPRGISGHIDHITMSMVSTFLFYKTEYIKELYYYCLSKEQRDSMNRDYFIYFPPGYKKEEISKTYDVSGVWDLKKQAIMQHQSQKQDLDTILPRLERSPKLENFMVLRK